MPKVMTIQLKNHPFRFLLYLEWGLLAVAIVSVLEAPPTRLVRPMHPSASPPINPSINPPVHPAELANGLSHSPLVAMVPLILFGLMGLYLPQGKLARLGHTLGQILLILLASVTSFTHWGGGDGRTFLFIYLILVIRGCLMFGPVGRCVLAITAFVLFVAGLQFRFQMLAGIGRRLSPSVQQRFQRFLMHFQLNLIVLFGLSLLLVVLLINALLTERQSQQQLKQANQDLRQSAQEIERLAMEQERSRIARNIHDSLGHSLTALNIQLESALKLWAQDPARAQKFLTVAKQLGSQSLQEVRQSVATLRQDPLAGETLEAAIARLFDNIQPQHQPQTNPRQITQDIQLKQPLSPNLKVLIYRIVQEGLTNIVKHAQAQHIHLKLISTEAIVTLTLEDDGVGFNPHQARSGYGLQSMRDRAQSAGGTFTLTSHSSFSQRGTRIDVSLPIAAKAAHSPSE